MKIILKKYIGLSDILINKSSNIAYSKQPGRNFKNSTQRMSKTIGVSWKYSLMISRGMWQSCVWLPNATHYVDRQLSLIVPRPIR